LSSFIRPLRPNSTDSPAGSDGHCREAHLIGEFGSELGRPYVDTLEGSQYPNMKELRRVAFAFDPERRAILLVGSNKSGSGDKHFYKTLIATADARFAEHLEGKGDK